MIFEITKEFTNKRLDIFLSLKINNLSRSKIKKIILDGFVNLNNLTIKEPSKKIKYKDKVAIKLPPTKSSKISPNKMNLDILFNDRDIVVLNKAPGIVIHPGAGNRENTIVNGLIYHFKNNLSNIGGESRPGIVHRIDKDTSGIIVVAKNDIAHVKLSKQFSDHSIKRKYEALVWGSLRPKNGKIEGNISRHVKNRKLMAVSVSKGKKAITNYKTIETYQNTNIPAISLVECALETGRTHQIRVHMNFKGNSIVGDRSYGKKKIFKNIDEKLNQELKKFSRQALHAKSLGFLHPTSEKELFFEAPRPNDFENLVKILKKNKL